MSRIDNLLVEAEALAEKLPAGSDNEIKRVARFYMRRGNLTLLDYHLPDYGRRQRERWAQVTRALKEADQRWQTAGYRREEIALILGWVARLLTEQ